MAGLIAMTSVFLVVGIEMFFAMKGAGHVHGSGFDTLVLEDGDLHPHAGHGHSRSANGAADGAGASPAGRDWRVIESGGRQLRGRSGS